MHTLTGYIIYGFLGLAMGSFANNLYSYFTLGNEFDLKRSKCKCGKRTLVAIELIPVFSYIRNNGKCGGCQSILGARYLFLELLFPLFGIIAYLKEGLTVHSFLMFAFLATLAIIAMVDYKKLVIPNQLSLFLLIAGIVNLSVGKEEAIINIIGAIGMAGVLYLIGEITSRVKGKQALGFGDVKLVFVATLFVGTVNSALAIWMASFLGVIMAVKNNSRKNRFPFGAYMSIGYMAVIIFDQMLETLWRYLYV